MHRRLAILALAALVLAAYGNTEAQQQAAEHRAALIAEHQREEDAASELLAAADSEPSVERFAAILHLSNAGNIAVDFRGKQMEGHSAVRVLSNEHPELYHQALFHRIEAIAAELPPDAAVFDPAQGRELHTALKVLADTVAERAIFGGVPSVNCFVTLREPDGGERRLTVGYLYPFGDYGMGDSLVVSSANLDELVAYLRRGLEGEPSPE